MGHVLSRALCPSSQQCRRDPAQEGRKDNGRRGRRGRAWERWQDTGSGTVVEVKSMDVRGRNAKTGASAASRPGEFRISTRSVSLPLIHSLLHHHHHVLLRAVLIHIDICDVFMRYSLGPSGIRVALPSPRLISTNVNASSGPAVLLCETKQFIRPESETHCMRWMCGSAGRHRQSDCH